MGTASATVSIGSSAAGDSTDDSRAKMIGQGKSKLVVTSITTSQPGQGLVTRTFPKDGNDEEEEKKEEDDLGGRVFDCTDNDVDEAGVDLRGRVFDATEDDKYDKVLIKDHV